MPRASKKQLKDASGDYIQAPEASQSGCPSCNSDDPQTRAKHQLFLARLNEAGEVLSPERGLANLREHLQIKFAQQIDTERRQQLINDICAWVAQQIKLYSGYADPNLGATLPWWDARKLAHEETRIHTYPEPPPRHDVGFVRVAASEVQGIIVRLLEHQAVDAWAHGHMILLEAGLGREANHAETAAACRQFATRWPQDTDAWEREAQWWKDGARGICSLDREPGDDTDSEARA